MAAALVCLVLAVIAGCQQHESKTLAEHGDPVAMSQEKTAEKNDEAVVSQTASLEMQPSLVVFNKRILPIFQSAKPSSCAECHLSGVDLKAYVRPTQQETFASLVAAGMIDVAKPDDSKILQFIKRSPENSSLITQAIRNEEYEAFREWIRAAVAEPQLVSAKADQSPVGPQLANEVIRHARKDRVLRSFIENIWNEVGRCAACHSPDQNQKQVKEHGEQVSWITLNDPQQTMNYMIEQGLIDSENPEQSLLLLKPTKQVDHGGGQKMQVGDRSYKQFRRFLDDYAAVMQGKYLSADQLPEESDELSIVTDIWLKFANVPAKFDKQLLQVDLYQKTETEWSTERVATSDRAVFGGGNLWQHSLSLTARRGTEWAAMIDAKKLPPGRYLAKIYVDQTGKLEKDFTSELGPADLIAELEIESNWPAGYGQMTVVALPD
jgi:hypothetical protein